MRVAILSDVHGNPIALDAVLADLTAAGGADAHWVLGDLAALGYDPLGAMERLLALPNARFTRGNTDRLTLDGVDLETAATVLRSRPDRLANLLGLSASFGWTRGALRTAHLDHLASLSLELRETLPDGTRVLGVHAAPGTDDGPGIHPAQSDEELGALLADADADLVFTGHTHWPVDRTVGGVRAVNLGSVSNPVGDDLRAKYVLLHADESGYELERRYVAYDNAAVLRAIAATRHPSADYLALFMRGEREPDWRGEG